MKLSHINRMIVFIGAMMKSQIDSVKKINKIYVILISTITIFILIKLFGIDFFRFDFIIDIQKYNIKINQLDELSIKIFIENIKVMIAMIFILRTKHGELYKSMIVSSATIMSICVFINIFTQCKSLVNLFSAIVMYLPKYTNLYIWVLVIEKIEPFIYEYNQVKKVKEEIIPLVKIAIMTIGTVIICSVIQSLFGIMII